MHPLSGPLVVSHGSTRAHVTVKPACVACGQQRPGTARWEGHPDRLVPAGYPVHVHCAAGSTAYAETLSRHKKTLGQRKPGIGARHAAYDMAILLHWALNWLCREYGHEETTRCAEGIFLLILLPRDAEPIRPVWLSQIWDKMLERRKVAL